MKKCSYCGRENDGEANHCRECGTAFPGSIAEPASVWLQRSLAAVVTSRSALRVVLCAVVSPFVIFSAFLVLAPRPGNWDYRVGIALAEIGGIACLCRLPRAWWIRLLCVVVYVPLTGVVLYALHFCVMLAAAHQ